MEKPILTVTVEWTCSLVTGKHLEKNIRWKLWNYTCKVSYFFL